MRQEQQREERIEQVERDDRQHDEQHARAVDVDEGAFALLVTAHMTPTTTPQHITAEHGGRTTTTIRERPAFGVRLVFRNGVGRHRNLPFDGARHVGSLPQTRTAERNWRAGPPGRPGAMGPSD